MCGIGGHAGKSTTPEIRQAVIQALAHRGPDAQGQFSEEHIFLAHLRLSILDTSERGDQPMYSPDERYVLVHNGEVYNFKEIRAQLPPQNWKTETDTEVILAAYAHWGPDFVKRLNGMFALAIWDRQDKSLFIARDRLGIKPLYFREAQGELWFASEVRALLAFPETPRRVDRNGLAHYLTYMTTYGQQSLLEGVRMLGAGEFILWQGGQVQQKSYWEPREFDQRGKGMDREEAKKEVRELLGKAVERRMLADVPLGAFLSGGIDSSAIVALMAQTSDQAVDTFSVVFDEQEFDESRWSQMIADRYRTRHHPILLRPDDFLSELPAALASMDHPSGDGLNSYVVAKVTREQGITVALSGLGGDELFAGYPIFTQLPGILQSKALRLPRGLRQGLASAYGLAKKGRQADKKKALLRLPAAEFQYVYPVYRTIFDWPVAAQLAGVPSAAHPLQEIAAEAATFAGQLSPISWAEIRSYTQSVLLRDMDQMSMAHALEARVPFFDHELVEFVLGLGDSVKWPGYAKQLLVEALGELIPGEIVHRKKMGFVFPWEAWLRGPLREWAHIRIERMRERQLIDPDQLGQVWQEFQQGTGPWLWTHVWLPVVLEEWVERHGLG